MPVETIQRPPRSSAKTTVAATPPRLRPKGPVGPDFYRQSPPAAGRPKQSAVERLEADKAKYVKSPVALSKQQPVRPPDVRKPLQQPVRPPDVRKPLLSPTATLRPSKKTQTQPKIKQDTAQLDLEHLSNLISDVSDGPSAAVTTESVDTVMTQQKKERPEPPSRPGCSSPAKVRLKASETATSPIAGTVRRVDVIPQARHVQTPCRPPLFIRQPLQPLRLHPQFPLRLATSHLYLRTTNTPLKPFAAPPPPDKPPASSPLCIPVFPPPSPAITRLSSSSARKRRSLTRSKSDMSDRFSRAGTELERFFNLCGLDPADLQELTGSASDIVSMARFRSVSAPGSECAGSDRQDEGDDEEEQERVPYGVSVIERNARVIKWLYGVRQAK